MADYGSHEAMAEQNGDYNVSDKPLDGWVRIQHSTFTNWANDKLRPMDVTLDDLRFDFKDGVNLCKLLQILQGHSIGRVIVKPNLKLPEANGNIALALTALQKDGAKLVNIGTFMTRNTLSVFIKIVPILMRR